MLESITKKHISRRTFLKISSAAAATTAASSLFVKTAGAATYTENTPDSLTPSSTVRYLRTSCMMCNAFCPIQVKVVGEGAAGILEKVDGNPFAPNGNDNAPNVTGANVNTTPQAYVGKTCAKGQAGPMTLYSAYRLKNPLKRARARGNVGNAHWQTISWATAMNEIVNGGNLREKNSTSTYAFDGLKTIYNDGSAMPAADIHADITSANGFSNPAAVAGYSGNRLAHLAGRDNSMFQTRSRFLHSFRCTNHQTHESMCNSSWKIAGKHTGGSGHYNRKINVQAGTTGPNYVMLFGANFCEAWAPHVAISRWMADFKAKTGNVLTYTDVRRSQSATKADNFLMPKPGTDGLIAWGIMKKWFADGTAAYAYNYLRCANAASVNNYTGLAGAGAQTFYTDASNLVYTAGADAGKKVRAGSDNVVLISDATANAATMDATARADLDASGTYGGVAAKTVFRLMREYAQSLDWTNDIAAKTGLTAAQIQGIAEDTAKDNTGGPGVSKYYPGFDMYRGAHAHTNGYNTVRAIHYLNALQERVNKMKGIGRAPSTENGFNGTDSPNDTLTGKATSTGVGAAGISIVRCINRNTYHDPENGDSMATVGLDLFPNNNPLGTGLVRQWYPRAARHVQQEVYPSAAEGYPYKIKAIMWICGSNNVYTLPFGMGSTTGTVQEILTRDSNNDGVYDIPLLISQTTTMDETSGFCDYVFPSSTFYEKFGNDGSWYGGMTTANNFIRRPVVGSYRDIVINGTNCRVYLPVNATLSGSGNYTASDATGSTLSFLTNYTGPMSEDDFYIHLANLIGLPNFGANAFGDSTAGNQAAALGNSNTLYTSYRWWDRQLCSDPASSNKLIGSATIGLGNDGSAGYPDTFSFNGVDADTTGTNVLWRGGAWHDGDMSDSTAANVNDASDPYIADSSARVLGTSRTTGYATFYREANVWIPAGTGSPAAVQVDHPSYTALAKHLDDGVDMDGNVIIDQNAITAITYKRAFHTQSRTTENKHLLALTVADNSNNEGPRIQVNSADFAPVTGTVKVTSTTYNGNSRSAKGVVDKVSSDHLVQGCAVIDHHFGRKWFGGTATNADNYRSSTFNPLVPNDSRISGTPLRPQAAFAALARSTVRKNTSGVEAEYNICLTDPFSGMVSYNSSKVKLT